jgi:hypothetical protein
MHSFTTACITSGNINQDHHKEQILVQEAGSADAPGLVAEAEATLAALEQALSAWRLAALLGGPYDAGGAVVSIQVQEWASAWTSSKEVLLAGLGLCLPCTDIPT